MSTTEQARVLRGAWHEASRGTTDFRPGAIANLAEALANAIVAGASAANGVRNLGSAISSTAITVETGSGALALASVPIIDVAVVAESGVEIARAATIMMAVSGGGGSSGGGGGGAGLASGSGGSSAPGGGGIQERDELGRFLPGDGSVLPTGGAAETLALTSRGLQKNTARIPSATGDASFRIPDGIVDPRTQRHLVEVKDVDSLSLTSQIRDDIAHVTRDRGTGRVDVVVDTRTQISSTLQRLADDPRSVVNIIREALR